MVSVGRVDRSMSSISTWDDFCLPAYNSLINVMKVNCFVYSFRMGKNISNSQGLQSRKKCTKLLMDLGVKIVKVNYNYQDNN